MKTLSPETERSARENLWYEILMLWLMKMERKWIFRSFFLLLSAVDGAESVGIECVVTRKEFNSIKGEFASSIKAVHVQQSDQVRQRWKGVSWKITIVSTLPWLKIHFFLSFAKLLVLDNKSWKTKFCSCCSHRAQKWRHQHRHRLLCHSKSLRNSEQQFLLQVFSFNSELFLV